LQDLEFLIHEGQTLSSLILHLCGGKSPQHLDFLAHLLDLVSHPCQLTLISDLHFHLLPLHLSLQLAHDLAQLRCRINLSLQLPDPLLVLFQLHVLPALLLGHLLPHGLHLLLHATAFLPGLRHLALQLLDLAEVALDLRSMPVLGQRLVLLREL